MGIDLQMVNERGEVLERIYDPHHTVMKILSAAPDFDESICLRFIDRYGDTVFNQSQIAILREELLSVPDSSLESRARAHKQEMLELAKKAEAKVHTYLKFYGD